MENSNRKILLGIIFIAVGIIFLLDNFDILSINIPYYLFTWQIILIVIGIFQLINGNRRGGIILITIGLVFWFPEYFNIRFRDYWPVILIAIGIGFFLKNKNGVKNAEGLDYIDDVALLGGSHKKINSKEFGGGKLTAILGGEELDLRQSSLAQGQATLDTFAIMGGIKIFVPDDWVINFEATNILGGFSDKRAHRPTEYFGNVLTIKGTVIMGGVELNS